MVASLKLGNLYCPPNKIILDDGRIIQASKSLTVRYYYEEKSTDEKAHDFTQSILRQCHMSNDYENELVFLEEADKQIKALAKKYGIPTSKKAYQEMWRPLREKWKKEREEKKKKERK